ncbi:MAG: hypothetical protein ACOVQA_07005 [Thermoflexibacteraceae bacterium]
MISKIFIAVLVVLIIVIYYACQPAQSNCVIYKISNGQQGRFRFK